MSVYQRRWHGSNGSIKLAQWYQSGSSMAAAIGGYQPASGGSLVRGKQSWPANVAMCEGSVKKPYQ